MVWCILLAFILGASVTLVWVRRHKAGVLGIYIPSDPYETPYAGAEFSKGLDFMRRKKYVVFKIEVRDLNTQK